MNILRPVVSFVVIFCFNMNRLAAENLYRRNSMDSVATICVKLPAKSNIILFHLGEHYIETNLVFSNPSNQDSSIVRKVKIGAAEEFRFGSYINGKLSTHTFIMNIGDSVSLKVNNIPDLEEDGASFGRAFIDSRFTIYNDWKITKSYWDFKAEDFEKHYQNADVIFAENQMCLDSLFEAKIISRETMMSWKTYLKIDHYIRLLSPISYNFPYNPLLDTYLPQKIEEITKTIPQLTQIKSSKIQTLLFYISKYRFVHSQGRENELAFYVKEAMYDSCTMKYSIPFLIKKFEDYPLKSSREFDSTFSLFKQKAGSAYSNYLDSVYGAIKITQVKNMNNVYLENVSGKKVSLSEILKTAKTDFVLVDFWASWCKPCRQQKPDWFAAKEKFKNKNVVFVSVSIDYDNKASSWMEALKVDGAFNEANELRLISPQSSVLVKSLRIETIPRYILFKKDGSVVHSRFATPDDQAFEKQLTAILGKKTI